MAVSVSNIFPSFSRENSTTVPRIRPWSRFLSDPSQFTDHRELRSLLLLLFLRRRCRCSCGPYASVATRRSPQCAQCLGLLQERRAASRGPSHQLLAVSPRPSHTLRTHQSPRWRTMFRRRLSLGAATFKDCAYCGLVTEEWFAF